MTEEEYLKTLDDVGRVTFTAWIEGSPKTWVEEEERFQRLFIKAGQAAAVHGLTPLNKRRQELIHKKHRGGGLTEKEEIILEEIEQIHWRCFERIHPPPPSTEFPDHIKTLIKEMENEEKS